MAVKTIFKNDFSCIAIKDDKMYILSNKYKDYSPMAITVISGFQIELGRPLEHIEKALNKTRLPIILKELTCEGNKRIMQIIRMRTGKVDDKVIAIITCINGIIHSISFNKQLLKDREYRMYNKLSVYHQLSLSYNLADSGCSFRKDQVLQILRSIISTLQYQDVTSVEDGNKLNVTINNEDIKMRMLFIANKKTSRFELISISLIGE